MSTPRESTNENLHFPIILLRPNPHLILLFLALCLPMTARPPSLFAAEEPARGRFSLPGQPCPIKALPTWTAQEKWVWKQVCAGEVADFNAAEGYGGKLGPRQPSGWPKNRVLRPAFLLTILLHEHYRGALTHHGVRIEGAWFVDRLDLSDAVLVHQLWLTRCRFDEVVTLDHLQSPLRISLAHSAFNRTLFLDSVQVARSLWIYDSKFAEVYLRGASIQEELDINSSTITERLDMEGLRVGTFTAQNATYSNVVLRSATIEGPLNMTGSTFTGKLDMERLQVGQSLFMQNVKVTTTNEVTLMFAKIHLNLDISGSELPSLNLTGTQVRGGFLVGSEPTPVKWKGGAKLTLSNTEVGALQDSQESWPGDLELSGFTYARLGGLGGGATNSMTARDISWFKNWLAKQKSYSPQPYEQLSGVFLKAGYKDKAEDILYESRERERRERVTLLGWLRLTSLKLLIGYGHYPISRTLICLLVFTFIGAFTFKKSDRNQDDWPYYIFYSLEILLPTIPLREHHYQINRAWWGKWYLYFHRSLGWVLASLLVASLTGLISK